jgi:anti-sigma B factor antagonist
MDGIYPSDLLGGMPYNSQKPPVRRDIILSFCAQETIIFTEGEIMEITTQEFKHCDLFKVTGRVDSATAPQFSQVLETANNNGRYKLVIDMSDLEYMSSAGFRALLATQRNCKRYNRGELVLSNVPDRIREAFELAGFTELFKIFDSPLEAVGNF